VLGALKDPIGGSKVAMPQLARIEPRTLVSFRQACVA